MEGTDLEGELAVQPQSETVFELYPNDEIDPRFGTYESIYHCLIAVADEGTTRRQ